MSARIDPSASHAAAEPPHDVVVVGGGPAGAATALALVRAGVSTLVIDAGRTRHDAVGESLPPSANALLDQLGVRGRFLGTNPLPYHASRSAWGTDRRVDEHHFIHDPYGHGWQIDRRQFDPMLLAVAELAGAVCLRDIRLVGVERPADGGWRLAVDGGGGRTTIACRFVVDASGRRRAFTRRCGIRWHPVDRLVAAVAVRDVPDGSGVGAITLVEATRDGWWYSAPLPDGRVTAAFFTDPDILRTRDGASAAGWTALLAGADETRRRVAPAGRLGGQPRIVSASSGRLEVASGEGWAAAGDAAATHDPLSSHGVGAALDGGPRVASAVAAALDGDAVALPTYAASVVRGFARYLWMWRAYYEAERRWPDAPFWRRRHRMVSMPVADAV